MMTDQQKHEIESLRKEGLSYRQIAEKVGATPACIGNGIVLDWEAQECTSLDGGDLLNDKMDGDPQFLPPGDSVISWTRTVAKLVVTPNWRFL